MSAVAGLRCDVDARRTLLLARRAAGDDVTGIDYVEVLPGQRTLHVHFIGEGAAPPPGIVGNPDAVTVQGGRRVRVRVTEVSTDSSGAETWLVVTVDRPGDFSDYVLRIHDPSGTIDEAYQRCTFNFKVDCPSRFDCRPPAPAEPPAPAGIEVDYLAKDYDSFRQALIDLVPRLSPQWTERLAADFGMTVLELLAYAADRLSYYQDAVANEAFLETARQRISVRRHARLVDYHMHDGASARTLVHFTMAEGAAMEITGEEEPFELFSEIVEPIGAMRPGTIIARDDRDEAIPLTDIVFSTFGPGRLDWRLDEMRIHTWGSMSCTLPAGAVTADLTDPDGDLVALLEPGDLLLFEEVLDPATGTAELADQTRRQVVRLTSVQAMDDDLLGVPVARVAWAPADALAFPFHVHVQRESGAVVENVSVARANLMLADHGLPVLESGRTGDPIASGNRAVRFTLERGPLSVRPPAPEADRPAAEMFDTEPGDARPQVTRLTVSGTSPADDWMPVPTLIGSDRFDHHFAVETDNAGRALLRFGDDVFGMSPPRRAVFDVEYRIGVGREGNIGADALKHVVEHPAVPDVVVDGVALPGVLAVRNPLPAWGGVEPESMERVKRVAPAAFRSVQHRAVTEADYAEVVERSPLVRSAVARFRWTGSWHTVFISVDPEGRLDLSDADGDAILRHALPFTQAGYDLRIVPPTYVPLRVALQVCVDPGHFRPDVEQAVRLALSTGLRPDGRRGFLHPDHFTFGQPLHLSALYAAVADVPGVESVVAVRFARMTDDEPAPLGPATRANLERGEITLGPLEILRLDDDRDFPENGLLDLVMQGGK